MHWCFGCFLSLQLLMSSYHTGALLRGWCLWDKDQLTREKWPADAVQSFHVFWFDLHMIYPYECKREHSKTDQNTILHLHQGYRVLTHRCEVIEATPVPGWLQSWLSPSASFHHEAQRGPWWLLSWCTRSICSKFPSQLSSVAGWGLLTVLGRWAHAFQLCHAVVEDSGLWRGPVCSLLVNVLHEVWYGYALHGRDLTHASIQDTKIRWSFALHKGDDLLQICGGVQVRLRRACRICVICPDKNTICHWMPNSQVAILRLDRP